MAALCLSSSVQSHDLFVTGIPFVTTDLFLPLSICQRRELHFHLALTSCRILLDSARMLVGYKRRSLQAKSGSHRASSARRRRWISLEWGILNKWEQGVLVIQKLLYMFS
jgi:hypothetical protein